MASPKGLEICSLAGQPAHNSRSDFLLIAHLKRHCNCNYCHGSALLSCIPNPGWLTSWQLWYWLQMRPHRMHTCNATNHNLISLFTILASHFLDQRLHRCDKQKQTHAGSGTNVKQGYESWHNLDTALQIEICSITAYQISTSAAVSR